MKENIIVKNFYLCCKIINNLDKSEISSKLIHEYNTKAVKLKIGQIERYILLLYLIENE